MAHPPYMLPTTCRLASLRLMDENAVAYSRAAIENSRYLIAKADECLALWAVMRPLVSALAVEAQRPASLSLSRDGAGWGVGDGQSGTCCRSATPSS